MLAIDQIDKEDNFSTYHSMLKEVPEENAPNSGEYIDCKLAGPTLKVPAIFALILYLKLYSP